MTTLFQRRSSSRAELDEAVARLDADARKRYDRLCREFMQPEFTLGAVRWRIYDTDGARDAVPEDEWAAVAENADMGTTPSFEDFGDEAMWGFQLSAPGYMDQTGWHIGSASIEATLNELLQEFADYDDSIDEED